MTIDAAQHNPYWKDVDDGTMLGEIFIGTQGLGGVQSPHLGLYEPILQEC